MFRCHPDACESGLARPRVAPRSGSKPALPCRPCVPASAPPRPAQRSARRKTRGGQRVAESGRAGGRCLAGSAASLSTPPNKAPSGNHLHPVTATDARLRAYLRAWMLMLRPRPMRGCVEHGNFRGLYHCANKAPRRRKRTRTPSLRSPWSHAFLLLLRLLCHLQLCLARNIPLRILTFPLHHFAPFSPTLFLAPTPPSPRPTSPPPLRPRTACLFIASSTHGNAWKTSNGPKASI